VNDFTQWTGSQPQWAPGQTGSGDRDNAAPFYMPNLIAAMLAGVGVVVGSIGPWITFLAMSRNAVDGDGTITLVVGIVSAAALFVLLNLGRGRVHAGWMAGLGCVAIVGGLIAFIVAVADAIEVNSHKTELFGHTIGAQIGWGLWMVLISSLALVVTSTVVVRQIPKVRAV
jgi:hypothetical protein